MVKESGGYVCDAKGTQNILDSGGVLAANDHLFEPLSKILIG
jgi:myo-inositol-1(or 4)-monophosphatase